MTEQTGPQPEQPKKLFRSKNNRIIGGVCAGFGDYLNIDPTIVRVVWVLLVIWGGVGILAYIAGLILVPENPDEELVEKTEEGGPRNTAFIWGILLIFFGLFFLSSEFDFWNFHRYFFWPRFFHWHVFWPVLIIFAGIIYIVYVLRKDSETGERKEMPKEWVVGGKRLYRVTSRKMIAGVCAGAAEYLNIDVAFVRLGWVVFTIFASWFSVITYVVLAIALPAESFESSHAHVNITPVDPDSSENVTQSPNKKEDDK